MDKLPGGVPLFRPEAVAHRIDALFGSVLIPRSRMINVLVAIALMSVALIAVLLFAGQYTRHIPTVGWLVHNPGDAQIRSTTTGTVSHIWIADGSLVHPGDSLVTISTARSSTAAADVEKQVLESLRAQQELAARRLALATAESARMAELAAKGIVSRTANEQTQNAKITAELEANSIQQRIADAQSQQDAVLRAPIEGRVAGLNVHPGDSVSTGSQLMVLIPKDARLQANLLVPSRASGFVEEGMRVRLRYDAFPYQRFGQFEGTIKQLDRTILNPADRTSLIAPTEPTYRAIIELDQDYVKAADKQIALQTGMTLQADIRQDRHRIIEWLLSPLLSTMHSFQHAND